MEISHNKEAKDLLIEGVNELNDVVSKTMGPNGSTVIIPSNKEYGKYIVTKDGVSVAEATKFQDPIKNIGAQLVKEAARNTVKEAGDGTTTATVLATAFINNLKDFPYKEVEKNLNEIIPQIIKHLENNSKKLELKDIIHVAQISANNDSVIAEVIQNAYNHSTTVKIEEGNDVNDVLELIDGVALNTGYMSKHFETKPEKGVCELDEPKVLIVDGKIETLKPFEPIIQDAAVNNYPLLIITEHINENLLRYLESNVLSGNIKLAVMKSPGFSSHRKNLLEDLSQLTKSEIVKDMSKPVPLFVLGKLQSASLTHNKSVLVKDKSIDITKLINILESRLKLETEDYNKELLQQRIENLKGGVSIIKVGGKTETEMKERFDRYDDAVRAVSCALEEGIVEGGGLSLYKTTPEDFEGIEPLISQIYRSLWSPRIQIATNGSVYGGDMFKQNIIDPLKVTKTALLNAVAVAKTILSTEAVVLHESEWKN